MEASYEKLSVVGTREAFVIRYANGAPGVEAITCEPKTPRGGALETTHTSEAGDATHEAGRVPSAKKSDSQQCALALAVGVGVPDAPTEGRGVPVDEGVWAITGVRPCQGPMLALA